MERIRWFGGNRRAAGGNRSRILLLLLGDVWLRGKATQITRKN
jgi:hypothetical protein